MILYTFKRIVNLVDKKLPANGYVITKDGDIRWANPRLIKLSQVSDLKAIKGKPVSIFGKNEWTTTREVWETKKSKILYENNNNKDYISFKIPCYKGEFHGIFGMSIDITKLRQAELARKEFIFNMNHDIRTPFSGIVSVFEILADGECDPKKKEWIKTGLLSSTRLLNFMQDINQIS